MNVNNQMFKLFKTMKEAYASNNTGMVEQCARCWLQISTENPFEYDTPEYEEYFQMQKCFTIWTRGDIDRKINRRRMVQHAMNLCALNPKQPYTFDKKAEQEEQHLAEVARKKEKEARQKQNEYKNDVQFLLSNMVEAYESGKEEEFKEYAIHLMDIAEDNPFTNGTEEYNQFEEMKIIYARKPNKIFPLAEKLCDIINQTKISPEEINKKIVNKEQQTMLGVVPDEEKEKKSWFKFLHPWKKEGE